MQVFRCVVIARFSRGGQVWEPAPEGERIIELNAADARAHQRAGLVRMKTATLQSLEAFEATREG